MALSVRVDQVVIVSTELDAPSGHSWGQLLSYELRAQYAKQRLVIGDECDLSSSNVLVQFLSSKSYCKVPFGQAGCNSALLVLAFMQQMRWGPLCHRHHVEK